MKQTWKKAVYSVKTSFLMVGRFTFGKAAFAIMLIAILHNLIYLPLKIRSARQTKYNLKKMQELKPAIKAIDEKYPREPGQRLIATQVSQHGNEIKRLYQEAGVSFSPGCISIILPVITGGLIEHAVSTIKDDDRFKDGGILWFKDLTQPDRYFVLLAILMGLSFLDLQFKISKVPDTKKPQPGWLRGMRTTANWSPLLGFLLGLVFRKGPRSGMALYRITSSSLELAEDYLIKKLITDSD